MLSIIQQLRGLRADGGTAACRYRGGGTRATRARLFSPLNTAIPIAIPASHYGWHNRWTGLRTRTFPLLGVGNKDGRLVGSSPRARRFEAEAGEAIRGHHLGLRVESDVENVFFGELGFPLGAVAPLHEPVVLEPRVLLEVEGPKVRDRPSEVPFEQGGRMVEPLADEDEREAKLEGLLRPRQVGLAQRRFVGLAPRLAPPRQSVHVKVHVLAGEVLKVWGLSGGEPGLGLSAKKAPVAPEKVRHQPRHGLSQYGHVEEGPGGDQIRWTREAELGHHHVRPVRSPQLLGPSDLRARRPLPKWDPFGARGRPGQRVPVGVVRRQTGAVGLGQLDESAPPGLVEVVVPHGHVGPFPRARPVCPTHFTAGLPSLLPLARVLPLGAQPAGLCA
mmetsp:Transcript_41320/g.93079  ORF Transcript_41320/g.93079 Transcript_41320/m.93079 type:complete len:389 (-) Transcript_41320:675-1841(-)